MFFSHLNKIVTELNFTRHEFGLGDIIIFIVLYTAFLLFVPFNFVSLVLGIIAGFTIKKLELV